MVEIFLLENQQCLIDEVQPYTNGTRNGLALCHKTIHLSNLVFIINQCSNTLMLLTEFHNRFNKLLAILNKMCDEFHIN